MANCNNLADEIKQIEDELKALDSLERAANAAAGLAGDPGPGRNVKLRTYTGDEVLVNPRQWMQQAEKDAMGMGEETVRQLVQEGFSAGRGPNGRTGSMINYRLMGPGDEDIATVLHLMGLERVQTPKGEGLARPFTAQVAVDALRQLGTALGNDPHEIAVALKNKIRGIDKLPSAIYMIGKARWDSASQYAEVLDDLADAIDGGYVTDAMKTEAGNVARWAHFFEQMDAQARRRVAQAMRAMQFGKDPTFDLINLRDDIGKLSLEDIKGDTLVADMLKQVAEARANELRTMSAAKRANIALGINEQGWKRQLTLLNSLRRANLLSSLSTWLLRNPVSGALVQGVYMAEDTVSGSLRMINKRGLLPGIADGLQGAGYAYRGFNSAFSLSWGNFQTNLKTGRSAFDTPSRLTDGSNDYGQLRNSKEIVDAAFNEAWDDITSWKGLANPLSLFNLINGGFWHYFGRGVERVTGSDAGYMGTFRLLNATDDFMKTQAYAWKVNHESFIRAAEEGRAAGRTAEWIEQRADELAQGSLYDGVMSDDQLARYRRAHAKDYGSALTDLSDDELRLQLYNQYKGVANTNSEIGRIGLKRAEDSTFTGDPQGVMAPLVNGVSSMRQNPLAAWAIPFWKVPTNGMGWVLNRDVITGTARYLLQEWGQARSGRTAYTMAQMMDARARTAVAVTIGGLAYGLWENGLFTDGGSFDPRQRSRERRNWSPYSFTVTMGNLAAGVSGKGIDMLDLMGLQADVARAFHDGVISSNEAASWNKPIIAAYANLLKNKAALKNITSLLNYAQDPSRYDFGNVLGDQMGGLVPISGLIGNVTRSGSDPEAMLARRRYATAEETAALGKDPNYKLIKPVLDALQVAADSFMRGNSGVFANSGLLPREKDWLGNSIERPLGLPLDLTIPFMPVLKPQDKLYGWLEKHGFGDKPRPDGTFEMGGTGVQMTNEEEDTYRTAMRETKGVYAPEDLGISAGRLLPIAKYVEGRTLYEALNELRTDPQYDALLNNPAGGISPSLAVQPGKSLAKRLQNGGKELYYPIDDIINYYDRAALMELMKTQPGFVERFQAVTRQKQQGLQQFLENQSPLGVGRQ